MNIEPGPEGRYLLDFDTRDLPRYATDILVVGGGVAGLSAALAAAEHGARVLILLKDDAELSNTAVAQGGIAVAAAADDSPDEHAADTLQTGCGLADPQVVAEVTGGAPAAVERLAAWGARFDLAESGDSYDLGREGGHGRRRILHRGDGTGAEIARTLLEAVRRAPTIRLIERAFMIDLLTAEGRCVGAIAQKRGGEILTVAARSVVLAAGGAGRLFRETSNVRGATGDGIAAAYRAGAELKDLEFVQFHPTTLYLAGSARVLVTEAVRGEGAHLIDDSGRRFLKEVHPAAELAPRDVVSRAIADQLAREDVDGIFLDLRHWAPEKAAQRFPGLARTCSRYGLDPARHLIPVRPAAHYFIGGVVCDVAGRTSLPGLWACGEAGCSGLHGANRLASNSLLEGLVLGTRAGESSANEGLPRLAGEIGHATGRAERGLDIDDLRKSLVSRTWREVGILRDGQGLADAAASIGLWRTFSARVRLDRRAAFEVENLLLLGALVTAAATLREESRGTHGRRDHPERDDARFSGSFHWRAGAAPEFRAREVVRSG
ncbi:MAG: L-aspartate oxidase [Planctomycetota bacterium]